MPEDRIVDVQAFLNEHPFSRSQWTIFALCFCVVLLDGFDTAAIGYIAPSLLTEWGVERPALAPVLSAALFGLAFGALAAGPRAVQRSGMRRRLRRRSRPPMAARKRSWESELWRLDLRMLKAKLRSLAKTPGLMRMRERSSPMVTSRL